GLPRRMPMRDGCRDTGWRVHPDSGARLRVRRSAGTVLGRQRDSGSVGVGRRADGHRNLPRCRGAVVEHGIRRCHTRTSANSSDLSAHPIRWRGTEGACVMATDLTLYLDDEPGELARVGDVLGKVGANIAGLCALTTGGGQAEVHILVEDATPAFEALHNAGIKITAEQEVI